MSTNDNEVEDNLKINLYNSPKIDLKDLSDLSFSNDIQEDERRNSVFIPRPQLLKEKKEGKEEKEKNNQFEIISEDEAKDIIKKDHEIKKNIMYALNEDENIFSNSDEDSDKDYLIRKSDSLLEFLCRICKSVSLSFASG